MADVQVNNGNTRIAHDLLEAIYRFELPGPELRILLMVARKTYGWQKLRDPISLSQFVHETNMTKTRVIRAIKNLVSMGVLGSIKGDTTHCSTYWIIKDYDKWTVASIIRDTSITRDTRPSITEAILPSITAVIHTKDNKQKIIKDSNFPYLHDGCFLKAFTHYLEMRKTIRKTATDRAKELVLIRLHKEEIQTAVAMLEQSTVNSWQGIFPIKEDFQSNKGLSKAPQLS